MALTEDEEEFVRALGEAVDQAAGSGVCITFISQELSRQGADLITATWTNILNLLIKVWIVFFCSVTPAAIWAWKCYAEMMEKKYSQDPWLNVVTLISLLAVVAQFFNVKAALPYVDRFIRLWKAGK